MKLSQMTTEQLQAKRARIDKILAKRQSDFSELFKKHHDELLNLHKKSGGKTFKGTFAELLNKVGFNPEYGTDDDHGVSGKRVYIDGEWTDQTRSVFGDDAHYDPAECSYVEYANSVREWVVVSIQNPTTQVEFRLLTESEAWKLLTRKEAMR